MKKDYLAAKELAIKMYPNSDMQDIVMATGLTRVQIKGYAQYAGVKRTEKVKNIPAYYQFATEILEQYPYVKNEVLAKKYKITQSQLQQFAVKHKVTKEGRTKLDYNALKEVEKAAEKARKRLETKALGVEPEVIKEDKPSELELAGFFDADKFFKQF